jgi:hypothetical protein
MLVAGHVAVRQHVALCVSSVAGRYFARGQPVVMATPNTLREASEHKLLPQSNEMQLANEMLRNLHGESEWPLLSCKVDKPKTDGDSGQTHQSYIITLWPNRDDDIVDSLQQQIDNLMYCVNSFNNRARFLLVVMDYSIKEPQLQAVKMAEVLWNPYKIINVLIMFPNTDRTCSNCAHDTIDLYTWFPYDSGHCGHVTKVDLLEQWVVDGNGSFRSNTDLFPVKVPRNLHGCPMVIAPVERVPFVRQTANSTDPQGVVTYMFEGLEIEYLLILAKAMNFTPVFLQRRVGDFVQIRMEIFMEIAEGSVDITVGIHPLHPLLVSAGDPSRPYYELSMKWWVPCGAPATRTEKIMAVFTPSVWVSVLLVFILTAAAFWRTAVGPCTVSQTDSKMFRNFHYSLYNVWAIFLGVSMPQLPKSPRLRRIFVLYVWYSFAMSTVFQVFFISFLVNPGYKKQIESFEELVDSGLQLATDPKILSLANASNYWEYLRLKLSTDSCSNVDECLVQLVMHRNMTTVSSDFQFEYILATIGLTEDKNKYLCTIPQNVFTTRFGMYVSKGNPLLDRFNLWIQRAMESGLVKKYWSQFVWNVTLQGAASRARDRSEGIYTGGDIFFVFSLSHLNAAFCQLLICYVFCFVVFVAECTI